MFKTCWCADQMPEMDEEGTKLTPPGQIRVMCWAPPRSLSTAFERCISTLSREDHNVAIFHEPFTTAYHLGPERQINVPIAPLKFTVEESKYTYSWVKKQLEQDFTGKDIVFVKDLGYSVNNKYEYLPEGYVHTFLLRDPVKIFSSSQALLSKPLSRIMRLKPSKIMPKNWVFQEMFELYEHLTKTLGQEVIVIDAEDLINYPDEVLELYCNATGIPYIKDMTKWCKGKDDLKRWYLSKRLMFVNSVIGQYERALTSTELGKPTNRSQESQEFRGEFKTAIEHSLPFYRKLYEKRLIPPSLKNKMEEACPGSSGSAVAAASALIDEAHEADEKEALTKYAD